jgi:hypothetical protein
MAQGSRSSRPRTTCCRCRRRAEGASRLTNLGWLCDQCHELLSRSELGRRLYRMVYQFSGPGARVSPAGRRALPRTEAPAARPVAVAESVRAASSARDEEPVEALVA